VHHHDQRIKQFMKTIIITGSTRGIGLHLAKAFLERDCNVVICGRSQAGVDKALKDLTPQDRVLGMACDVSDEKSVRELVESAVQKFGSVDIFIHNAGTTTIPVKFVDAPIDEIQATIQTKVMGAAHSARAVIPQMQQQPNGGAIYFVEGMGTRGDVQEGTITLGTANNAVVYLLKGLQKEYEDTNIIFCRLRPGMNVTKHLMHGWEHLTPERQEYTKRIFNILADYPETTAPTLADLILTNKKNGATIRWLTTGKLMWRFLTAKIIKRDLFEKLSWD
jgi:NAD(P)-dependent dehydrogenase (short-subunit alcohol dehydrogenase family)